MRRIKFLLPLVGLAFATTVFAFFGNHEFLEMTTTTSDGHVYKSEYRASGSFPFDGTGSDDGSRVNLKGVLNVFEIDSVSVDEVYCVKLRGTLSVGGGELTAIRYVDAKCKEEADRKTYTVSGYSESSPGSFTVEATDEAGVFSTASGTHGFVEGKKGKGPK